MVFIFPSTRTIALSGRPQFAPVGISQDSEIFSPFILASAFVMGHGALKDKRLGEIDVKIRQYFYSNRL